jgi:transmembrane sensor
MGEMGRLKALFERYSLGVATEAEKAELMDLIHDPANDEALKGVMDDTWHRLPTENVLDAKKADVIFNSVLQRGRSQRTIPLKAFRAQKPSIVFYRLAAAIGFLLLASAGLYLYINKQVVEKSIVKTHVITPGGNKAILQLADGSRVELDSAGTSQLPRQGASSVLNRAGQISYQATGSSSETLYNSVITPRGGKYQLQLSDGSKVWLNAVSSLRYPTAFSGNERIVELTGEAYFEIAKNKSMPFKVRLASGGGEKGEVEVLGTHFNVMAYEEEGPIKTTLLEGSVKVSSQKVKGAILSPNQQAQIFNDGKLSLIKRYDVSLAVAWKNDTFLFDDTDLASIMRQVARWYDVEVVYEGDEASKNELKKIQFGGKVSRRENASEVLNLLKLTGAVDFEVKGRTIVVRKAK